MSKLRRLVDWTGAAVFVHPDDVRGLEFGLRPETTFVVTNASERKGLTVRGSPAQVYEILWPTTILRTPAEDSSPS